VLALRGSWAASKVGRRTSRFILRLLASLVDPLATLRAGLRRPMTTPIQPISLLAYKKI
jgi:hypothetical protein